MHAKQALIILATYGLVTSGLLAGCASGTSGSSAPQVLNNSQLPAVATTQTASLSPLGQTLLGVINEYRKGPPLGVEVRLQRIASVHAADMAARNFRGHHNPEGQGPLDRMLAVNPDFKGTVGENIWVGTRSSGQSDADFAQHVLQGWLNSPSHRTLLESDKYSQTGVGIATQGNVFYAVQTFSR
ncbi:MAG: CAP domain-containing protein [Parvibaculum sp.]